MTMHTKSAFKITSWEQKPYDEPEKGPKLLRVEVKRSFQGEVEAESTALLLMCQSNEENAAGYVATERVVGRIGSRAGSFVIQHGGAVAGGEIMESFGYVVPGSGTAELQGLRGRCIWRHDEHEASFILDYDI